MRDPCAFARSTETHLSCLSCRTGHRLLMLFTAEDRASLTEMLVGLRRSSRIQDSDLIWRIGKYAAINRLGIAKSPRTMKRKGDLEAVIHLLNRGLMRTE
jgi:hypothetical protein